MHTTIRVCKCLYYPSWSVLVKTSKGASVRHRLGWMADLCMLRVYSDQSRLTDIQHIRHWLLRRVLHVNVRSTVSKYHYIIVRPKAGWTGLICRTHQYYLCQWLPNEWSNSRRQACGMTDGYGGKEFENRRILRREWSGRTSAGMIVKSDAVTCSVM